MSFQSTRRGSSGSGRNPRRAAGVAADDPLNPDRGGGTEQAPAAEDDLGDSDAVARSICLRALTGAPKTRQQLADLLAARGVPDDAAEAVLDRFTEVRLIDDAAFARAWVSSRQAGRGLARRALSAELRAKGVQPEVVADAVQAVDDDAERATAAQLVARRLPGMRRLDRVTASRRLVGMLARKGYSGGLAAMVVRQALDGAALLHDVDGDELADDGLDALDEDVLLG